MTYTFGADQKIVKIQGFGKVMDSMQELGVDIEALKALKSGLINKIADNAITKVKEGTVLNEASLDAIKDIASKFKDGVIPSATLSAEKFLSEELKDAILKIKDSSKAGEGVKLSDSNTFKFSYDNLNKIIADGISQKLEPGSIKAIEGATTVDNAKTIIDSMGSKISGNPISLSDTAANINNLIKNPNNPGATINYLSKINSIDASDNAEITLTKELLEQIGVDKLATDDNIKVTDLGANDKQIALSDKVDSFTMYPGSTLNIEMADFDKLKTKTTSKFTISDTSKSIQDNLSKIIENADKFEKIDSTENDKPIDFTGVSYEDYLKIKDKLSSNDKFINVPQQGGSTGPKNETVTLQDYNPDNYSQGDTVKITDVKGYFQKIASDASETFMITGGDEWVIKKFGSNDKINVKAMNTASELTTVAEKGTTLETGKIYKINLDTKLGYSDFTKSRYFSKLFNDNGETFLKQAVAGDVSAILIVEGTEGSNDTQIYKIESKGDNSITNDDVKLLGTVSGDNLGNFTADNMDFS